jgi:hypothetical protein
MIKLDAGNVLLKRSQRRQLMTWLKRAVKLGQRLGDFVLNISFQRIGNQYEVKGSVHDSCGDFGYRSRQRDWRMALRELVSMLTSRLHQQCLTRA